MAWIFHLNMQNYGGASVPRNALFDAALNIINGVIPNPLWVAGFTEIRNGNAGGRFYSRARVLNPSFNRRTLIEVGVTAVGNRVEHLGIAWNSNSVAVQSAGQVLYLSGTKKWNVFPKAAVNGAIPTTIALPAILGIGLGADTRGLAYIAGTAVGKNHIFAFMHNLYAIGDRYSAIANLNGMAKAILTQMNWTAANTDIYIGGDFNVRPYSPGASRAILHHAAAVNLAGQYVNTTAANPYDFWFTNDANAQNADARVYAAPLNNGASDHSAVSLNI